MGFSDALNKSLEQSKRQACRVHEVAKDMEEADRSSFLAAVSNNKIPVMVIYRALKDMGLTVSRDKIKGHREGICECHSMTH